MITNSDALFTLLIKPLYYLFLRPAVQIQLLAVGVALLLAWLPAKQAARLVQKRLPSPARKKSEVVLEEEFASTEVPARRAEAEPEANGARESLWRRVGRFLHTLVPKLIFPLLGLITLSLAHLVLIAQNQLVGLVDQILNFLWLLVGYRLIVGLLHATMEEEAASRYHNQLLTPLFWLLVGGQALAWIISPTRLAGVEAFTLFENPITWGDLFLTTVGLYFWLELIWVIQDLLYRFIIARTEADPGAMEATLTLIRYALITVGLLFVFSELNLNPTTVAVITGGVSAGLAFGSAEILNNFIGGILLLFEHSVRPGDTIEINGVMGVVSAMNIRSTTIQGFDGRELIVPNKQMLTSMVTSYTKSSRHARIRIDIGVSYGSDLRQVLDILRRLPQEHANVLLDPPPNAFLAGFGESSVDFALFAWVEDLSLKFITTHELYFMIWDVFAAQGIEIPNPQRDVHLYYAEQMTK